MKEGASTDGLVQLGSRPHLSTPGNFHNNKFKFMHVKKDSTKIQQNLNSIFKYTRNIRVEKNQQVAENLVRARKPRNFLICTKERRVSRALASGKQQPGLKTTSFGHSTTGPLPKCPGFVSTVPFH